MAGQGRAYSSVSGTCQRPARRRPGCPGHGHVLAWIGGPQRAMMRIAQTLRTDTSARDEHILKCVAEGGTAAVAELYDCYGRLVFSLIIRMVGDAAIAEELVQDVFVSVWHAAASYRPELGSVRTWLLAIAHHRAVDELRRRRKEKSWVRLDDVEHERSLSAEDQLADPLILRSLETLPPEQRVVVQLAYFDGLTILDIALQLDLAPGTVKSRLRLAMGKLRAMLGAETGRIP